MTKELTPLEAFYDLLSPIGLTKEGVEKYTFIEIALKEKEKQDKILRIIKEKDISSCSVAMNYETYEEYSISCFRLYKGFLTQEEYDLLKGWLNGSR